MRGKQTTPSSPTKVNKVIKAIDEQARVGPAKTILLVWADWCPHCVTMRPAWDETIARMSAMGPTPNFAEIESRRMEDVARIAPSLYDKIMSTGHLSYPTILMIKPGQAKPEAYAKERNVTSMVQTFSAFSNGRAGPKDASAAHRTAVLPAVRKRKGTATSLPTPAQINHSPVRTLTLTESMKLYDKVQKKDSNAPKTKNKASSPK